MGDIQTRAITQQVWQAEATWEASTSLYTGGDTRFVNNADLALLRDCEGRFYIPGASLRGAARAWLRKKYGEETPPVRALFGDDFAGLLFTYDASVEGSPEPSVRDHVRIDPSRRTAAEEGKFNREVLPKGVRFKLRFRVMVPMAIPQWDKDKPVTIRDLEAAFRDMLEGFCHGEIRLGGKRTRGSGYGAVAKDGWTLYQWNLLDRASLLQWLGGTNPAATGLSALTAAPKIDKRRHTRLTCNLRLATSLLIRSSGGDTRAPDMVHMKEGQDYLLPFTSLCGPLRHQCQAIANGLPGAGGIVDRMFGPVDTKDLYASRVSGPDAALREVEWRVQTRVAIDRFTAAALDAHLFDEAALWPKVLPDGEGHVHIELELDETPRGDKDPVSDADRMVALLLAAFKDLWVGWLTVGGESGVGRGVFTGVSATIERKDYPPLTLNASGRVEGWNGQWANVMASLKGGNQ